MFVFGILFTAICALAGNLHGKKPPVPTIFQYAEKMMDEQLALNEIRQSSYDRKMETLKMLSAISNKPLDELTEDDIIAFFKTQLDYSQSCINKMYQLLGAVRHRRFRRLLKPSIKRKSV